MEHDNTLTELALILAAAFLGGTVLNRLKQPVLVGYIVVGFLVGPSVFGIIHDEKQVQVFAEFGILLLLFIVGIELDLKKFAPVYKAAIIVACSQITISLLSMFALGQLLDWPLARILLLGFALSLSSTAVAIQLLKDRGELNTHLGRSTIGILIAQDIAVIPMLLIVNGLGGDNFNVFDITKLVFALSFMAALIYSLNKYPQFFTKIIDRIPVENQSAVTGLALCFSAAALSGLIGISTAYGAFLAGLILGNTSKHAAYEANIRPIFEVLMMVFFLSIGLLLDIEFLFNNFSVVMLLLLLAMGVKTIVNIYLLKRLGFSRKNSFIMGASLGQIGEFSFVLAALGLSVGAILPEGYKFVVSIIALSLIVTPVWLYSVRNMGIYIEKTKRKNKSHL